MEDAFVPILKKTLQFEGGYNPNDPSGSYRGVRQDIYTEFAKKNKLPNKDVRNLKWGEIKDFYKKEYWDSSKISKIKDPAVAGMVFDFGVNAGPGTSIKKLQEVIGSKPDGVIGPKTLKALDDYITKKGVEDLKEQLLGSRANYYYDLYTSNPQKYGGVINGWNSRVNALKETYLQSGIAGER